MKKLLLLLAAMGAALLTSAQCTTSNATSCVCPAGASNCDLLPDISVGKDAITASGGYTEYAQINAGTSQSGQGSDDGRLRLTGSTPNIGYGPMEVRGVSKWVCGTDTVTAYPGTGTCPDGSDPKQVVAQRVYHKNGSVMTYSDREAGTMTYHPTHGHQHIDGWGFYTLRIENPTDPNPLNWPIVGSGSKLAFCLLDLSNCNSSNGHCRDSLNNILTSTNLPNYGLGGGQYGCSNTLQGISAGYVDIYSKTLDGMWINIPQGTCNGNYWIVVQIDPNNNFQELRENNNVIAVPITLTRQTAPGTGVATISSNRAGVIAPGDVATLTANAGTAYTWSTGATTQSIQVSTAGTYSVTVTSPCGTATSAPYTLSVLTAPTAPSVTNASRCGSGSVTLGASGSGTLKWYTGASGGISIATGSSYTTPTLSATTNYYVSNSVTSSGTNSSAGPASITIGAGAYNTSSTAQYLVFNVYSNIVLQSIKVYSNTAASRTFTLFDKNLSTLRTTTVPLVNGTNTVTLNWSIPPGDFYRIQSSGTGMYYNTAGVSYPYNYPGLLQIHNSSGGHGQYYYFYDWQVRRADIVQESARTMVTATINPIPSVSFTGLAASYTTGSSPATLTGSPSGGTFSGPGISGNTFTPSVAGAGGPYTVTYTYTNAFGCTGTATATTTVTAAGNNCLRPTGLGSSAVTNVSATVSWSNAATADTFRIRYSVNGTTNYLYKDVNGAGGVSSTGLSGLSPGTTYQFQVSSICRGVSSGYSNSATFTTTNAPIPCAVPNALSTTNIANNSATVGWTPFVTADVFRIRYYVNGTSTYFYKDLNGSSGSSTSLTNLTQNTTYKWQVSSICNGVSSGYSSVATFTTTNNPTPCGRPFGLGTSNVANTSATVSWTNLVTADIFRIRYSVNGTTNYLYKDVSGVGGTTSASLTGLTPNTTYQFQVSSICSGLSSGYSTALTFTTTNAPVPCATPYGLSSTNVTNNSAVVNWTPMVTADSFMVRYSVNGTTNYLWKKVSGAGGVTSMSLTGLSANTTYQWQVRSICNGVTTSIYSSSALFTTGLIRQGNFGTTDESDALTAFPNPAHENVQLRYFSGLIGKARLTVYDLSGRSLLMETKTVMEGENRFELSLKDLQSGTYLIRLDQGEQTKVIRIVKE